MANSPEELALSAVNGDRSAFASLYDLFFDAIYRFVLYHTFRKETAEDLTSMTFLKALDKIGQYDVRKGKFSSWLYGIARNLVTSHIRRSRKELFRDLSDQPDNHQMEKEAESSDRLEKVRKVLLELRPDYREMIILRCWEGKTHEEIAGLTGKSVDACKMAFSRAMGFIRTRLPPIFIFFFLFQLVARSLS